ncbi:hypothetical protein ACHAPJ_004660 [Fusarium lateritium]
MASLRDADASGSGAQDDVQSISSDLSTADFKLDFKQDLLEAITNIKSASKFAFSTKVDTPPKLGDLGISVDGIGEISLPLGEPHARQIITKARQAPYGKGSDTIVDTSVRNTWELNPTQFTIGWSGWPSCLKQICDTVAQQMGISTTIHAELYKMLLYEKGAMFKAHTDTEKIPGMFGTLVVTLPSAHTGGEVVLKHRGEEMTYTSSKYDFSCAGWYSDVSHEVLPVTSGYRWVLTYNLAIDHSLPPPSAALKRSELRPLRHCIRRWLAQGEQSRKNNYVHHALDHEYTEANVSYRALKGEDFARVSALVEVCKELPVTMFLALLEKEEMGDVEIDPEDFFRQKFGRGFFGYSDAKKEEYHQILEVSEMNYKLKTLKDLHGKVVTESIFIREDDILDPECFADMVGEEEYEGYMGNYGPSATHWYRLGAVTIVPHDSIVDFFSQSKMFSGEVGHVPEAQINYLAQACLQPNASEHLITAMLDLVERVLDYLQENDGKEDRLADHSVVPNVLRAALQHNLYDFFERVIKQLHSKVPPEWYGWLRQWLINNDSEAKALERFDSIKKGLSHAMSPSVALAHRFQSISHLVPLPNDLPPDTLQTPQPILEWTRHTILASFSGFGPNGVNRNDGEPVVDQAFYFDDPMTYLAQSVVPIFEGRPRATAFRFKVLSRVRELAAKEALPTQGAMSLYRTLTQMYIASQDFGLLHDERAIDIQESKRVRPVWCVKELRKLERLNSVTHEHLSHFFTSILDLDNLASEFMAKVSSQADKLPRLELYTMWLPFLRSIIPILEENKIPLNTPSYQKFFSVLTLAIIDGYVGPEPPKPVDWALPGVNCNCGDCESVNAFLNHPTKMSANFRMKKQRRQHIQNKLDSAKVGCTYTTMRNSNPQTLVVTKTIRPQDEALQKWQTRRDEVLDKLNQFQQDDLKTLLGPDYARIKQLVPEQVRHRRRGNLRGPVAGEKHRIDDTQ